MSILTFLWFSFCLIPSVMKCDVRQSANKCYPTPCAWGREFPRLYIMNIQYYTSSSHNQLGFIIIHSIFRNYRIYNNQSSSHIFNSFYICINRYVSQSVSGSVSLSFLLSLTEKKSHTQVTERGGKHFYREGETNNFCCKCWWRWGCWWWGGGVCKQSKHSCSASKLFARTRALSF